MVNERKRQKDSIDDYETFNQCFAYVENNGISKRCKRKASYDMGCKFFCWQHAKEYGGEVDIESNYCKEKIPECSSCNSNSVFPCRKKLTVFSRQKDFNEYCSLKSKKPKSYKRSQRKEIAELANKKLSKEKYGRKERVVRFEI